MHQSKRLTSWALVLFAGLCCWAVASASAQNPKADTATNQNAQRPVKILKNPNIERRQAAMDQLAASVDARTQNDPQFKKYVQSVIKYNNDVDASVKAKKGGLR
jgi:hypothetical protein